MLNPRLSPRLSGAEMREIDYSVMAQAFATHCELRRLCDEGIPFARILWVNITFHALAFTTIDRSLRV